MQDPNADTEWNDVLREKGILPPKVVNNELEVTQDALEGLIDQVLDSRMASEKGTIRLEEQDLDQLDELLDEDGLLDEDEAIIRQYREQRIQEYQRLAEKQKFGYVQPISKGEFTSQVTESSKEQPVIVLLYRHSCGDASRLVEELYKQSAARQKATKYTAIESVQCIPNYPDANVPTLLLYRNGELVTQLVGIKGIFGAGAAANSTNIKQRINLKQLEKVLHTFKMIDSVGKSDDDDEEDQDEEEDDDSSRKRTYLFKK